MTKLLVISVTIILASLLLYLNIVYPLTNGGILFSLFAVIVAVVKIWESFYSSKEKNVNKYHGDWTLLFTSILYLVAGVAIVIEFFVLNREINYYITCLGLLTFISAVFLRRWSIITLGDQWAIHLVDESKLPNKPNLIIAGPYKYFRHPIYLSYILDLIGIALIVNTFYSLLIIFIINIPSYVLRALYEERISVKRFGDQYLTYKEKTHFMFPFL